MKDCASCTGIIPQDDAGLRMCRSCWREAKAGRCPFCFEAMRPAPVGRFRRWLHSRGGCPMLLGWGDRRKGGALGPVRVLEVGSP